jgi:hypothetical protein
MENYNLLEFDELKKEITEKYRDAFNVKLKLYKGITSVENELLDYYIFDPKTVVRQSKTVKENGNIYNLLLNNLQNWKTLPKREKSIITSSNLKTANAYGRPSKGKGLRYGKTYVVIPLLNEPIVISYKSDILFSFQKALLHFNLKGKNNSLVAFNSFMYEIFKAAGVQEGFDFDWKLFCEHLNKISKSNHLPKAKLSFEASIIYEVLKRNSIAIDEYLNNIFDPRKNEFVVTNYSLNLEGKEYYDREVWTESECLLINHEKIEECYYHL